MLGRQHESNRGNFTCKLNESLSYCNRRVLLIGSTLGHGAFWVSPSYEWFYLQDVTRRSENRRMHASSLLLVALDKFFSLASNIESLAAVGLAACCGDSVSGDILQRSSRGGLFDGNDELGEPSRAQVTLQHITGEKEKGTPQDISRMILLSWK